MTYETLTELEYKIKQLISELEEQATQPNRRDDYVRGIKYACVCLREILEVKE
jgi:hypothetical protein